MSRARAKGTAAETALVKWFRDNGFPGADRQPLRGGHDCGDLTLCPGIVAEVKNHHGATGLGQPPAAVLTKWMAEAEVEKANADAAYCPLIVKRAGTTDPGRWWAYTRLNTLIRFASFGNADAPKAAEHAPVCLTVASLAAVLRHAGYGNPPDEVAP